MQNVSGGLAELKRQIFMWDYMRNVYDTATWRVFSLLFLYIMPVGLLIWNLGMIGAHCFLDRSPTDLIPFQIVKNDIPYRNSGMADKGESHDGNVVAAAAEVIGKIEGRRKEILIAPSKKRSECSLQVDRRFWYLFESLNGLSFENRLQLRKALTDRLLLERELAREIQKRGDISQDLAKVILRSPIPSVDNEIASILGPQYNILYGKIIQQPEVFEDVTLSAKDMALDGCGIVPNQLDAILQRIRNDRSSDVELYQLIGSGLTDEQFALLIGKLELSSTRANMLEMRLKAYRDLQALKGGVQPD